MAPPIFIECSDAKQIEELQKFLRKLGADVDQSQVDDETWPDVFVKCIPQFCHIFRSDKVSEADSTKLLNTISSIVLRLPLDFVEEAVDELCSVYVDFSNKKTRKHFGKLYALDTLLNGLPKENHSRYRVYRTLITCASELGELSHIHTETETVENLLKECQCTPAECQELWRQMSKVHESTNNTKLATQAMIHLLSTYTDRNAPGAGEDAFKCIVSVIKDPSIMHHGQLLSLMPVQLLKDKPIHKLLEIYVSGGLADFTAFVEKNPKFLAENGLDEKVCLDKLRTLALMEIAENASELDYSTACKKLDIPEDRLESFIIEAVRQKVINCKFDQINRRILITSAMPRSFGRPQWQGLYNTLMEWQANLRVVQSSLASMIEPATAQ